MLGVAIAEDSITRNEEVRTCLDYLGNSIVSYAAIHFNSKPQPQLLAELRQPANLIQRKTDKFLPAKARIYAHDQHMMQHRQDIEQNIDSCGRVQHHAGIHAVV